MRVSRCACGPVTSANRKASAILPIGFAFFDERTQAFLRIFEAVQLIEENIHGMLQTVAQGHSNAAEDGFFRHGKHRPGVAVDAIHEVGNGFFELRFGDEAIDHAEIESAFGSYRFAGEHQLESDLWADKKWKNCGRQRRKDADADFRLSKARFGSGDNQVAESRELRTATNGRTVHDGNDRYAEFKHAGEGSVEGIEHLENALRSVFADVDAATKDFACRIENDQLDVVALSGITDAVRHFTKHGFVEKIVLRAIEGHAGDAAIATQLQEFEFFGCALDRF